MPQAVTHILVPLLIASLFRDYYFKKNKRKFPLEYVLIIGIAGIIPDLDVLAFWVLSFFGFSFNEVHRTFMHTLFVPLIFMIFALIFSIIKVEDIGRHKLKLNIIFVLLAVGSVAHLVLDWIFVGYIRPVYPFSDFSIGLNLFGYLPLQLQMIAPPSLDAGLFIIYLVYLEVKHKISDFI